MLGSIRKIFSKKQNIKQDLPFITALNSEAAFYAIGDIHGCATLLQDLLQTIKLDRQENNREDAPLVLMGDFIDRGDASADVLEYIKLLQKTAPYPVICLMGNHEKMMLDYLDDPAERGGRWLRFGGVETLASYGIHGVDEKSSTEDLLDACEALEQVLPEGMESWLRDLPLYWQNGNICCVHAAMSPNRSITSQDHRVFLWGHPDFLNISRADGLWVLHGHTIVSQPQVDAGRIAIDTGAYQSGKLTAVLIADQSYTFF